MTHETLEQTLQREAREKLLKYRREYTITSKPNDYLHVGLDHAQFFSHLEQEIDIIISETVRQVSKECEKKNNLWLLAIAHLPNEHRISVTATYTKLCEL